MLRDGLVTGQKQTLRHTAVASSLLPKLWVASSSLVFRSYCFVAVQSVVSPQV